MRYPSILLSFLLLGALLPAASAFGQALIYQSDACSHCKPYINAFLPVLRNAGYDEPQIIDFINNPAKRAELARLQARFNVPLEMQGHMLTVLDDRYLLEGHVPLPVVQALLAQSPPPPAGLVLYQDSMSSDAKEYTLWSGGAQALQCTSDQSPAECEQTPKGKIEVQASQATDAPASLANPGPSSLSTVADAPRPAGAGFPLAANTMVPGSLAPLAPAAPASLLVPALMMLSPLVLLAYYYYENRSR